MDIHPRLLYGHYKAIMRPLHGLYTAYIWPLYGLYTASTRPLYGLYTATIRPLYGRIEAVTDLQISLVIRQNHWIFHHAVPELCRVRISATFLVSFAQAHVFPKDAHVSTEKLTNPSKVQSYLAIVLGLKMWKCLNSVAIIALIMLADIFGPWSLLIGIASTISSLAPLTP